MDYTVDPCRDFFRFVCNTFRGHDQFSEIINDIKISTISLLKDSRIPSSNQVSWQKAAGMFRACVSFLKSNRTETKDLLTWMRSLNLDLMNETRLAAVNPVEMMVRASLDLGVQAVLGVVFALNEFYYNKRSIKIEYSKEQDMYLTAWRGQSKSQTIDVYLQLFLLYGATPPEDHRLASKISGYEKELGDIAASTAVYDEPIYFRRIIDLAEFTKPYVNADQWATFFYKYSSGTYDGASRILHQKHVTTILVKLFESQSVGENGLRYLVAWSIYRQLVRYTVPDMFLLGPAIEEHVSNVCYEHVKKVMNLAVKSPYLQSKVTPHAVDEAKRMVTTIRSIFRKSLETSSWLTDEGREGALGRLDNMTIFVGSPAQQFDPDFVDQLYKPYPETPMDRLFPSWIKALSLSSHYIWSDQTTWFYDEAEVNAHYISFINYITVPTGMIQHPLFYPYGPLSLNYGGLGMIVGHEIMHAFDVQGVTKYRQPWVTAEFLKEYTNRTLCLRKQHRSVLLSRARQEVINDTADSENLADLVGTMTAYAAFTSLSPSQRNVTLAGLDMSAERLFFVNHCVKWCNKYSFSKAPYAPHRSRCIVPLMNMPEFSRAYGCAAGQPMNPQKKCTFW
ncbi:neprilysin-1-like [Dermacentor andersoni]|uniref:neprilysin-1-like n=1 Tax=Dermacentor andersoni TaxID=34620 RepID=UPI002416FD6B|nr:neprilysin-1-like [Dermacentor andersoni]